ncbi:hypothetical protein [Pseudophaeobacter sp.]|uniref:hypothetical protein n=1 Tax=Pseudophaeobacter sp. TaxID=1971739 RepID=UPI003296F6A2
MDKLSMSMLIFVACGVVLLIVHVIRRGRVFARSADYLRLLESGASVEEANRLAASLFKSTSDPDYDRKAVLRAKMISDMHFGGKQMPIIRLARSKGFYD